MTDDAQLLPYQERTDDSYAEQAAKFEVRTDDESVELTGPCPRCGHMMTYLITDFIARHWLRFAVREPDPATESEEPMLCTCDGEHPGRPSEGFGCGAYWNLKVSR